MTRKTKTAFGAAAVLAVSMVSAILQYQQVRQADELHASLVKKQATLKVAVDQLKSDLAKDAKARALALARVAGDGATYVPVKKDVIAKFGFNVVDANFKLTTEAIGLLGLTADESAKLQNVLTEMQDRIHAYHRTSFRGISPDDVDDPNLINSMTQPMTQTRFSGPNAQGVQPDPVVTYIPKAPGQLYVYEIPPIGADSLAALQNWFFSSVAGAIGPDRADIVVTKASQSNDFWLQSGEHVVLAIMDRSGTNDSDISGRSEWKVYTYNGNGGTGSMSGSGVDSVPPQWAYLFQDATDNATPAGK